MQEDLEGYCAAALTMCGARHLAREGRVGVLLVFAAVRRRLRRRFCALLARCAASLMLPWLPNSARDLFADRGHVSVRFREAPASRGITSCIPSMLRRKRPIAHDAQPYRQRHRIRRRRHLLARSMSPDAGPPPASLGQAGGFVARDNVQQLARDRLLPPDAVDLAQIVLSLLNVALGGLHRG